MAQDISNLKEARNLLTEIQVKISNIEKGYEKANTAQKKGLQDYGAQLEAIVSSEKMSTKEMVKRASLIKRLTDGETSLADVAKERAIIIKKMKHHRVKEGGAAWRGYQTDLKTLDSAEKRLKTQKVINAGIGAADKLTGGMASKAADLKDNFKDAGGGIKGGLLVGLGLAAGLIAGIAKQFSEMTGRVGKEFGVIGMQSQEISGGLLEASKEATRLGKGMEEIVSITNELTDNFGYSVSEAIKLSASIADTASALGMSDEEAAKLFGTLTTIAGVSEKTAENFMKQTALLAHANDVAPKAVLQDIANSSETIAKFTGMTPDNIAKAAVMAKKLGTNLDAVGGIMEGLLDFQNSLTKEIEASLLIGRDINFQRARELALNNDIEGAMKNVVSQLGSEEEFSRMNFFQRKALADALGTDVATMAKMVNKQKEARSLNDVMARQQPLEKMIGRNSMDALSQIIADFKAMTAEIAINFGPQIMNVVSSIAQFVASLSESKGIIPMLTTLMGAMLGKSIAMAWVTMATALGKSAMKMPGPMGLATVIAIPAIVGAVMGHIMRKAGDVDSPAKGKTMVSTKEGGIFELSPRDDFAAAPGLSEALAGGTGGRNVIVQNTGPDIHQQKQMFSEVMRPFFRELTNAVHDNTKVNINIKDIQEEAPRKMAERINNNQNRYS